MKYALNLAEDGRILSVTREEFGTPGSAIVDELPDGNISEYRYVNGEIVYDPLPKEPEQPEPSGSVWDELDAAYQRGVDSV